MTSLERAARAGKTPSGSCYCVWWNSAGDTPSRPSCLLGQDYAVSPVVSRPGRKFERCQHPSPSDCPAHQRHTLFFPVHQEVPKTLQWGPGLTVGLCTGSCTGGQQTFPRIMTGGPEGVRTTTWAQDCCAWPGTTCHLLSTSLAETGTGCSHGHRACW